MNRKLKESIREAFDAPKPMHQNKFLLSLNFPKTTLMDFILAQAGYIRKRVWSVMILAVIPALATLFFNVTENTLGFVWCVSSLLPFIALVGITEISRSVSHNMAELEMSCKYSFSDVVLARLGILGCTNMALFAVTIAAFRITGDIEVLHLGFYLFVPYLLSCSLSLFVLNRLRSREGIYICGGISGFVSITNALLSNQYRIAFTDEFVLHWAAAFIILLIWAACETIRLVRNIPNRWSLTTNH